MILDFTDSVPFFLVNDIWVFDRFSGVSNDVGQ